MKLPEPVAWLVTAERQDGTQNTFPMNDRYKDVRDLCDFGEPKLLFTETQLRAEIERRDAVLQEALYVIEAWERGCEHEDYWRDRDDAITAIKDLLDKP